MSGWVLGRRTALIASGQALVRVGQLGLVALLVRVMSPHDFDELNLVLSIYLAALGIGGLSLHQSVYFFYARLQMTERRSFALQTVALTSATGAVTATVVYVIAPLFEGSHFAVAEPLHWLALALLIELPTLTAPELLLAAEKPRASTAFTVGASLAQAAAIAIPASLGLGSVRATQALCVYACARALCFVTLVWPRLPPGTLNWSALALKRQLWFSAPLGLAMATSALNRQIDKWYVAALLPEAYGSYVVAAQEVPLIPILPYAIGAVLATRLVHAFERGDLSRVRAYWQASTSRVSLVVLPLTVGVILVAPEVVPWFATAAYGAATVPFCIYTAILLHRVAEYGVVLRAAGQTRALWTASLCLLIANAVLSLPFVWWWGSSGAAFGTLLANVIAWIYMLRQIARAMDCGFAQVLPWSRYAAVLCLSLVAALCAYAVTWGLGLVGGLAVASKSGLFMLAYAFGLLLSKLHQRLPKVPRDSREFAEALVES